MFGTTRDGFRNLLRHYTIKLGPHRGKSIELEEKFPPRWKVAFQRGEARSKYQPGLYRKRGNYICDIIIAVDFFGNLFPEIQRTLGNSVETLRGKRNLKVESSGFKKKLAGVHAETSQTGAENLSPRWKSGNYYFTTRWITRISRNETMNL